MYACRYVFIYGESKRCVSDLVVRAVSRLEGDERHLLRVRMHLRVQIEPASQPFQVRGCEALLTARPVGHKRIPGPDTPLGTDGTCDVDQLQGKCVVITRRAHI